MLPEELLAKSRTHGKLPLKLQQHLEDTEVAARSIFQGRILQNWCRFFKVKNADRFSIHLRVAALFHDIGKANAEFYTAADTNNWTQKQTLRHEWLSALILHLPNVREWLEPGELDLEIITAAVLSHHLQAHPGDWGKPRTPMKVEDTIDLFLQHSEIHYILHRVGKIAGVEGIPELPDKWSAGDRIWKQAYEDANDVGADFGYEIEEDDQRRSLLLAVKAGVIAADSVASGIFRTEKSDKIPDWVERVLHQPPPITPKELQTQILQPRYRQIRENAGNFQLKSFQRKAPRIGDRALLLSGCGSGKTLFAYKWHQAMLAKLAKNKNQVGHVIFLYPTRGTATEGFKDYVGWAPEADASLLTGTALYELQGMRENPPESTRENGRGKDYTTDKRLYALGYWDKRFFSATVDQFLSFLTHNYNSICLLPVLADSVVVIDEVHSFSGKMFGHLCSFLEHFDIPVLCMTATLPPSRKQQLEEYLQVFPAASDRELKELEERPRYCIESPMVATPNRDATQAYREGLKAAEELAVSAYREGKLVLWVVNTVDRCRDISLRLASQIGDEKVLTYHSRYTLDDRQDRHAQTVEAFKFKPQFQGGKQRQPVIAVTTQVCEMSLDLDADVLITELAPIPSLVQRFGRSNRASERDIRFRSRILVYEPGGHLPYEKKELDRAREFLSKVTGEVSQAKLAEELERFSSWERKSDDSPFLTGGYWAVSESFRSDEDGYTVDAFLRKDLETIEATIERNDGFQKDGMSDNMKSLDGYVLPVPKKFAIFDDRPDWMLRRMRYMAIADDGLYCRKRGFGK
ncbi:MAG: CRISPR-associated helicase Cas3' [Cyanobacteriota bacterium]|nr:CRISPR-associated helicase Cas3' [Cyanobacteriota bacterium]